jgi:hypothetical protein
MIPPFAGVSLSRVADRQENFCACGKTLPANAHTNNSAVRIAPLGLSGGLLRRITPCASMLFHRPRGESVTRTVEGRGGEPASTATEIEADSPPCGERV